MPSSFHHLLYQYRNVMEWSRDARYIENLQKQTFEVKDLKVLQHVKSKRIKHRNAWLY